jgi:hypothetical protein
VQAEPVRRKTTKVSEEHAASIFKVEETSVKQVQAEPVRRKTTDVSEEHVASIFDVEEQAKQETSVKAGGKRPGR